MSENNVQNANAQTQATANANAQAQQAQATNAQTQQAQPQPTATAQPTALAPKSTYGIVSLKESLNRPSTIESFKRMLGAKGAARFTSALINIVGQSADLQQADTTSIILAAGQSAALNLPLNPSLGMAAVIAYKDRKSGKSVAQFQMMRNGLIELAQRSGKIVRLTNEVVYEGELKSANRFTDEYDFSGQRVSNKVIGYMAYAKLTNGFEKTVYMTREEAMAHGQRYSKTFSWGKWKTDFDAMALKTVLKRLINKYLPKTEELAMAIESDQASFTRGEIGNAQPEYIDNPSRERAEVIEVEAVDMDVEAEEVK